MNIRDLEYLVELHRHAHFGKAAEACFVSQPTLSSQFKKLEKEIGVPIIDRSAKGVVFSEAGLMILAKARNILRDSQDIREIGKHYKDPEAGTVKVGVIPTIGPYLLPLILNDLRQIFPKLRFQLKDLKTHQVAAQLSEGELDLGILALPLNIDEFEEQVLYQESFLLAVPHGHLKAKEKNVDSRWLSLERLLLLEDGHCFGQQALQLCSMYGAKTADPFRGSSLETLRAMVSLGEGVTPVPQLAAKQWQKQGDDLGFIPFSKPVPQRQVGLLWRKTHLRQELYQSLGRTITKVMKSHCPKTRQKSEALPIY